MDTNEQMEAMDADFAAFEQAFNDTDGYQTDTDEDAGAGAEEQPNEETETAADDGGESNENDGAGTEETAPGGEDPGKDTGDQKETFTLRVNKEDKTVSREEVISLAQKGYDYDRVKGQLTESRQTIQQLQAQVDKSSALVESLEMVAKDTDTPVEQLIDQLHISYRVKKGESEAEARANIRALKAEKQISAMKEKATQQTAPAEDSMARAEREVAEFKKRFPGVELTEELCKQIGKDVNADTSIADAYQKLLNENKDAEIAELKRQIEAEKQNKLNRAASPGSQTDSGGRRGKSEYDDFMAAFK